MLNPQVVVISKDQATELPDMVYALRGQLPNVPRLFVLDRCTDLSAEVLTDMGEIFIEKVTGKGWEAGATRDFGMAYLEYNRDFLFFDGDRIPSGLTEDLLLEAFTAYDVCLIKLEKDLRPWFRDLFTPNPMYGRYMNDTYTAAFTITRGAARAVRAVNKGRVFHPLFDGMWGYEDMSMGDIARALDLTCGGFPRRVLVGGSFDTKINREHFVQQMTKRKTVMTLGGLKEPKWEVS